MADDADESATAGFAERLLEVIDSGRRISTYKLAVLFALIDLCARDCTEAGKAPGVVYTRDVAAQVVALYWRQVRPFRSADGHEGLALRQIRSTSSTILNAVGSLRQETCAAGGTSLANARSLLPRGYESMLDRVEITVARDPLPRLQIVGNSGAAFPFLYELSWGPTDRISVAWLREHGPRGAPIRLFPGAGDQLVRLSPLIRPLVELHWMRMVADINGVAPIERQLQRHLFGDQRFTPPRGLREGLLELQRGRCFYCDDLLASRSEVDHFLPRARCGLDAIENLVLADFACNNDKRDLLAAPSLIASWVDRNESSRQELGDIAGAARWESDRHGTFAVARSIYSHLPRGRSPLWLGVRSVVPYDRAEALRPLVTRS